jgi:hypothetical protein
VSVEVVPAERATTIPVTCVENPTPDHGRHHRFERASDYLVGVDVISISAAIGIPPPRVEWRGIDPPSSWRSPGDADQPPNCTVTSPNGVVVTMPRGLTDCRFTARS